MQTHSVWWEGTWYSRDYLQENELSETTHFESYSWLIDEYIERFNTILTKILFSSHMIQGTSSED